MAVKKESLVQIIYWSIPMVLMLTQAIFTFKSLNQIRYEELAESVRNAFWLEHHTIYDLIVARTAHRNPPEAQAIRLLRHQLLARAWRSSSL